MTREEVQQMAIAFMNDPEKNHVHNRSKSCSEYMADFAIEYAANHLPYAGKLIGPQKWYSPVDTLQGTNPPPKPKQLMKHKPEAHLPDAWNKVEPSGDSGELAENHLPDAGNKVAEDSFTRNLTSDEREYYGGLTVLTKEELEQREREAFKAGILRMTNWEYMNSNVVDHFVNDAFDQWQSTRDNSRGKEATND